jgi:hypothetical protein
VTARVDPLRLCECGEWTYSPVCGGPCRRPACRRCMLPAGSPECCTAATLAGLVRTRQCGHRVEQRCGCDRWRPDVGQRAGYRDGVRVFIAAKPAEGLAVGIATYGGRWRS